MPTYEYRCPNGHEFEKFQRMSDPPLTECPECGEAAERVLSGGAGFLFKGEGFYITDYRSESYKKEAAKDKGDTREAKPSKTGSDSSSGADAGSKGAESKGSGSKSTESKGPASSKGKE